MSRYDEPAAWVRLVATRLAVSRWRRTRTAVGHLARQRAPEPARGPDETSVALVAGLRGLPEAQRRAVVLHHLGGLSVREVAQVEGCAEGTVKARLSRGRAALAVLLVDDDPPGARSTPPSRPPTPAPPRRPTVADRTTPLDRALGDLAEDVASTTRSPGATRAVGTARRRRTGRTVGLVATAAVVAAGLGLQSLAGGDGRALDVGAPTTAAATPDPASGQTPEARPLTAAVLTEATAPWAAAGWEEGTPAVWPHGPCNQQDVGVPVDGRTTELRSGNDLGASIVETRWGTARRAAEVSQSLLDTLSGCVEDGTARAERTTPPDLPRPGRAPSGSAQSWGWAAHFAFTSGEVEGATWVATSGDRVAVLTIVGAGDPPHVVRDRVTDALVAALGQPGPVGG